MRRGASAAAIALMTQAPCISACPLCQALAGESLKSYFAPTIVLSLLPVAILGSIVLWLRRSGAKRGLAGPDATPHTETSGEAGNAAR